MSEAKREVNYAVGHCVRGLRENTTKARSGSNGRYSIEMAAGDAEIPTGRWQRIETRERLLNEYLTDLDKIATTLGVTLPGLLELARVR